MKASIFASGLLAAISMSVNAASVTYSDQASFLSSISGWTLDNLESYPTDPTHKSSISLDHFTVSTVSNDGGDAWLLIGDDFGNYSQNGVNALVAGSDTSDAFTLTFSLNAPTNYIGFNLVGFGNGSAGSISISTNSGDQFIIATTPPEPNNTLFFGLVNTDKAFTEFVLMKDTQADGIGLDEIYLSTVPVPPALWLFGSGFLSLLGMARRSMAL